MMQGKFIVIDGPDFCGKGTQTRLLVMHLMDHPKDRASKAITVVATREPSNSMYGMRLREMLANLKDPKQQAHELAMIFIEDRAWHVNNVIEPNLKQGNILVSDRYSYSTIAYQHAQGVELDYLVDKHRGFRKPHLTILILPSVESIIKRKAAEKNRPYEEVFEKSHDFIVSVRENYRKMKDWLPDHNIVILDGDRTREEIAEDIKAHVDKIVFG